jgi:hypothetical protein
VNASKLRHRKKTPALAGVFVLVSGFFQRVYSLAIGDPTYDEYRAASRSLMAQR